MERSNRAPCSTQGRAPKSTRLCRPVTASTSQFHHLKLRNKLCCPPRAPQRAEPRRAIRRCLAVPKPLARNRELQAKMGQQLVAGTSAHSGRRRQLPPRAPGAFPALGAREQSPWSRCRLAAPAGPGGTRTGGKLCCGNCLACPRALLQPPWQGDEKWLWRAEPCCRGRQPLVSVSAIARG